MGLRNHLRLFILVLLAALFALNTSMARTGQVQVRPEPAPPRVLAGLKHPTASTRRDTANQLGALRARNATRALMVTLVDKDASVREASAFALGQITDPAATEALVRALSDKDTETRASAAFALGMIGNRKSTTALSKGLEDDEPSVRAATAVALGLMQDTDAVDELIAMLDDESLDVRYDAVWALGQIGEPDAADALQQIAASLDALRMSEAARATFNETLQNAMADLRTEAHAQPARPRRATGVIADQPRYSTATRRVTIRQSARALATERATRAHVTGTVTLRALVAADGRPVRAYVTGRLGYGLDQRAVQAALQYKFEPALEQGLPQTTWVEVEVKF
jgi:TonB family protein